MNPAGEIGRLIVPEIRHGSEKATYPPRVADSHIGFSQTPAAFLFAATTLAYSMNTFAESPEPITCDNSAMSILLLLHVDWI